MAVGNGSIQNGEAVFGNGITRPSVTPFESVTKRFWSCADIQSGEDSSVMILSHRNLSSRVSQTCTVQPVSSPQTPTSRNDLAGLFK